MGWRQIQAAQCGNAVVLPVPGTGSQYVRDCVGGAIVDTKRVRDDHRRWHQKEVTVYPFGTSTVAVVRHPE